MLQKKQKPSLPKVANLIGFSMILFVLCSQLVRFTGNRVLSAAFQVEDGFLSAPIWAFGIYSLLVPLLSFLPPLIFLQKQGESYGLRIELTFGSVPLSILLPLFLGCVVIANALTSIFRSILLDALNLPLDATYYFPETLGGKVFYFISACIFAPVLEELFFRGTIQGLLHPFGRVFAMVLTSVLFTTLHLNILELPAIFALSIMLCYVAEITGSVFPTIVLHFANNVYSFISLWARNRLEGLAALMFSFWIILLVVVFFAGAVWAVRRFRIGKKLFLPRQKERVVVSHRMKIMIKAPAFSVGVASALVYFILRIFVL